MLIFPKGNNVDHLSMYLDVADSSTLPYGWSRYAQFSLAVVNQVQPKYTIKKGSSYTLLCVAYMNLEFVIVLCCNAPTDFYLQGAYLVAVVVYL